MKNVRCGVVGGVLAGLCIALGGTVYLSCENKMVGALLFCVALLSICYFGFSLYTGKIGYLAVHPTAADVVGTFSGLLGNAIACAGFGLLARVGLPAVGGAAQTLCDGKMGQTVPQTLIRAFFCGVLMYIAVWIFRSKNTPLGIFLCIPTFILSGFEHSIADMFYFAAAARFDGAAGIFLLWVVLGNSVGGMCIPLLQKLMGDKNA